MKILKTLSLEHGFTVLLSNRVSACFKSDTLKPKIKLPLVTKQYELRKGRVRSFRCVTEAEDAHDDGGENSKAFVISKECGFTDPDA